jgi:peptide/nickel transport system permease protein
MPAFLAFLLRRFASILLTLVCVTVVLYGIIYTLGPEERAMLYFPKNPGKNFQESSREKIIARIIQDYGLNDPFPVQYGRWAWSLATGQWGYSLTVQQDVLPALLRLTPATAELTLFSLLGFIPLGIVSGVVAATRKGRPADYGFRASAFIATSMPPFILAILLMCLFYVYVHWFPPGRLSDSLRLALPDQGFHAYTGFFTLDGLLNGRPAVTLEALQHLVLPVITLSAYHWATLGRITRSVMIEELGKDYVTAARARGVSQRQAAWHHAFRNSLVPALNSSLLSAASLVTGVFIVESIFDFPGLSRFIKNALILQPDTNAALGFSIYTVLIVLSLMLVLDVLQALADPRHRQGISPA